MLPLLAKALTIAVIAHTPCPGTNYTACAIAPNQVYVSADAIPGSMSHELAHIFDFNFLTDAQRQQFERLTNHNRPWWTGRNPSGEQFAEAARLCSRSMKWPAWAGYNYDPTTKQHRRVCRWMATLGR